MFTWRQTICYYCCPCLVYYQPITAKYIDNDLDSRYIPDTGIVIDTSIDNDGSAPIDIDTSITNYAKDIPELSRSSETDTSSETDNSSEEFESYQRISIKSNNAIEDSNIQSVWEWIGY